MTERCCETCALWGTHEALCMVDTEAECFFPDFPLWVSSDTETKSCLTCKWRDDSVDRCYRCLSTAPGFKLWAPLPDITQEQDPNDVGAHAPGAKLDDGKLLAGILQQFSLALTAVAEVATFGSKKYSRGGWQHVENGVERYGDAMMRHWLKEGIELMDLDSGLLHEAHLAWNALARLELMLRKGAK